MTAGPLLSVDRLETTFYTKGGAVKAVDGVSYTVGRGETVGIVGESGCGKSVTSVSLLRLVAKPGQVTGGRVVFKGEDLLTLRPEALRQVRGKQIAMIFQEPMAALNPVLSVGAQIAEQIRAHEAVSARDARDRAVGLMAQVGIPAPARRADDYPHQLSGGMRQRAMIAMALSLSPDLLIADEPTTALDVTIQAQILDLLQRLQDERHMAIQLITHDLGVVSELADHVVVMYAGKVVERASAAALFAAPRHPYTLLLLGAMPRLGARTARLATIPGSVPPLQALPPGCRFQNRCPRAEGPCRTAEPPLTDDGSGHAYACYHPH